MRHVGLALTRQQQQRAREPFLAGIEQLVYEVLRDPDVPRSLPGRSGCPATRAGHIRRFDESVRLLRQAYATLADDIRAGVSVASAAEWLLDNFDLVAAEIIMMAQPSPAGRERIARTPTLRGSVRATCTAGAN